MIGHASRVRCKFDCLLAFVNQHPRRKRTIKPARTIWIDHSKCMQRKCAAHSCVRSSIYRSVPLNQATRLSYIDLRTSNNSLSARTKHWQTTNLSDSETDSVDILFVIFFCAVGNTCRSQLNWVLKITVFSCFWLFSKLPCFPSNWNGLKCSVLLINAGNDLESLIVTKSTSNQ